MTTVQCALIVAMVVTGAVPAMAQQPPIQQMQLAPPSYPPQSYQAPSNPPPSYPPSSYPPVSYPSSGQSLLGQRPQMLAPPAIGQPVQLPQPAPQPRDSDLAPVVQTPLSQFPAAPGPAGAPPGQVPPPTQGLAGSTAPAAGATDQGPPPPQWPNDWVPAGSAKLQALDKVGAQAANLTAKIGQPVTFGSLTITVKACVIRPPTQPADAAAYLVVDDSHPDSPGFSGWMLANEPSVSMMQNPIYDLHVAGCG